MVEGRLKQYLYAGLVVGFSGNACWTVGVSTIAFARPFKMAQVHIADSARQRTLKQLFCPSARCSPIFDIRSRDREQIGTASLRTSMAPGRLFEAIGKLRQRLLYLRAI